MKIIKNQYFFFILLSALLLIFGISFVSDAFKSDARGYSASATIKAPTYGFLTDTPYCGYTIYGASPTLKVRCGTYNILTGNIYKWWAEINVDSNKLSDTSSWVDAGSSGKGSKGRADFSYNSTYYTASVVLSNDGTDWTVSSGSEKDNHAGEWSATMTLGNKECKSIKFYSSNGSWYESKSTTGYYGQAVTGACSNAPYAKYWTGGWRVGGSTGSLDEDNTVYVYSLDSNVYYADYKWINYITRFNANGGSGSHEEECDYNETCYTPTSGFSKTGHKLTSWNTRADGSGTKYSVGGAYSNLTATHNTSVTLYAQWEPITYKVQYNSNDGTGSTVETGPYEYDDSFALTINKFKRIGSGYCFGGWKTSPSATSPVYTNGQTVSNLTTAETTVNLYVHWVKEQYTILYYATQDIYTSGGNAMSSATVTYGASYTFPIPTRTGYLFDGWKHATTSEIYNGSGTIPDWGNDGDKYIGKKAQLGTEDNPFYVPLYATWTPITYKINFDANTGSGSMESMSKTFDTPKRLSANRFTKEGYNFVGWSLEPQTPYTCEDTVWQETLTNANWSRMSLYTIQNTVWTQSYSSNPSMGGDIYFVTGSDTDDGTFTSLINSHGDEITIYAVWEAVDYEIVFDGNGATDGSMINLAMIYDVAKTLTSNTYTRDGYLFLGWHRDKDSTEKEYNNIQSVKNVQLYDEENKTYRTVVEGDKVKLYAVWKETWAIHNEKPNGSGTVADPYLISTPQELAWISYMYETATAFDNANLTPYFLQTANIDLSEYEWLPIGNSINYFGGIYDGNGYLIKNVQTQNITNVKRLNIGLFGFSNAGTIKNVRLFGEIKGNTNVGGILGMGQNVTFENCTNFSTITATQNTGGIAGFVHGGKYLGCYNYGDISATNIAGGIVGRFSDSTISNCYVNATINGANSAGIASYDQGSTKTLISSCAFEGNCGYGAIVGYSASTNTKISNCIANCSITDDSVNYGLCTGTATIENCVFEINGVKRCLGNDFSAWVISSDGRPLPSGLSWLAIGGTKVTDISQITVNYTKVG